MSLKYYNHLDAILIVFDCWAIYVESLREQIKVLACSLHKINLTVRVISNRYVIMKVLCDAGSVITEHVI
jgi:hypothetical protein